MECAATPGHGEWHLTGNIHEGTNGSILVARTWVRRHAAEISRRINAPRGIKIDYCSMRSLEDGAGGRKMDVHVHLPETEVAKDVSINGAAVAVSLISVMTGVAVLPNVAILGEITLAGVLWPLEQVNEAEVMTARDNNITHLILPEDNLSQIEKVSADLRDGLKVTGAVRLMDVLEYIFETGAKEEVKRGENDDGTPLL